MGDLNLLKTELISQITVEPNTAFGCCYKRTTNSIKAEFEENNCTKYSGVQANFLSPKSLSDGDKISNQQTSSQPFTIRRSSIDYELDKLRILINFEDAPKHLQFNSFIRKGYRKFLPTKLCFESMFWWTNETVNIWSHLFGWFLFIGLTIHDVRNVTFNAALTDKVIMGSILICFQMCMLMSSLYHIFNCRSENDYHCFLSYDMLGISMAILVVYISGIYYAFWCLDTLRNFYMTSILTIFAAAMIIQIPRLNVKENVKFYVFVGWAAYGVLPAIHYTIEMGGFQNTMVRILIPRIIIMYIISLVGLIFYLMKIPERWFSGKCDFFGHSHNWWHFLMLFALYWWHNTGVIYLDFRMKHGCATHFTIM